MLFMAILMLMISSTCCKYIDLGDLYDLEKQNHLAATDIQNQEIFLVIFFNSNQWLKVIKLMFTDTVHIQFKNLDKTFLNM